MKSIFTKINNLNNDSLLKEAKALKTLENHLKDINELNIPKVISVSKEKLQLENINFQAANSFHMETLALGLSKLHKKRFKNYGLEYDNFIGLNPQKNIISNNWGEFFVNQRLNFQVNMIQNPQIKEEFLTILNKNKKALIDFLNNTCEFSSLVHGDLWSGNVLFDNKKVYLIDPAIYFGDREVDIAMTELFGGFSSEFYRKYNDELPLSKEYEDKKIIFNLYHYLNHFNLFGSSYLSSCENGFNFIQKLFR